MNDETKKPVPVSAKLDIARIIDDSEFQQILDTDRFGHIQRVARLYSESDFVTDAFRGKVANCAIAIQTAVRLRIDPVMLMQHSYLVHGRPGMEAQLVIALVNARGPFTGPLQWKQEGEGDKRQWTCYATHKVTGELCQRTITWAIVKAEGWDTKPGSKWKTIPDQMGCYRSATWLARLYCPEVLLGFPVADELEDIKTVEGTHEIQRREIPMPQPKPVPDSSAAPVIDVTTGEIKGEAGPPGPGATGPSSSPDPADVWKGPASEAQRRAIMATGKRLNLNDEEINTIVQDATTFTVATLPMGAVNAALGALAKYKPEA